MNLARLTKIRKRKTRRLGQGHGSGRGKTSGRGTKGQKARGKIKLSFEGGALPLIKRMPFLRGKGRNKAHGKPLAVTLSQISKLSAATNVNAESLVKAGIVGKKQVLHGVKVVGSGTIKDGLTITLPATSGARKKIEKAGSKVELES